MLTLLHDLSTNVLTVPRDGSEILHGLPPIGNYKPIVYKVNYRWPGGTKTTRYYLEARSFVSPILSMAYEICEHHILSSGITQQQLDNMVLECMWSALANRVITEYLNK